jgi:hypothetical protein
MAWFRVMILKAADLLSGAEIIVSWFRTLDGVPNCTELSGDGLASRVKASSLVCHLSLPREKRRLQSRNSRMLDELFSPLNAAVPS